VAALIADASGADASTSAAPAAAPRRLWFRPGNGFFSADTLAAAREAGHATVLGTVWPWDTLCPVPLANALFCWLKAYSGAVIVLHDRCVRG
jgi:peptidoglycan/xylan/chitin deacetylase (PgdA/CDA1 family)